MLEAGIITPSSSEWASPVHLVCKKNCEVCWCVDYYHLNSLTAKDAYHFPKIGKCFDVLGGVNFFSTLDLQSGHWQIAVDEKDQEKTVFITRYGLYEYTRLPFGLCNAPSMFQWAMELILHGLPRETLLIYLDVIILGRGIDEITACRCLPMPSQLWTEAEFVQVPPAQGRSPVLRACHEW